MNQKNNSSHRSHHPTASLDSSDQSEIQRIEKQHHKKQQFLKSSIHVVNAKAKFQTVDEQINKLLEQAEQYTNFLLTRHKQTYKPKISQPKIVDSGSKRRRNIINDEESDKEDSNAPTRLLQQPTILHGGQLKEYQLTGLNWLISLFEIGINGILADEMGLGKTIQTIAFIAFLRQFKKIHGPHLIIAPKSTLGNWEREFKKWLPQTKLVKLIPTRDERDEILAGLKTQKFDVILTSYEGVNICLTQLRKHIFRYVIIDEAHKMKNEDAMISTNIKRLNTNFKLMLTGTPLQNNPHELWSLLNYLLPDLFNSSEVFDKWFEVNADVKNDNQLTSEELKQNNLNMVQKFHKILRPFMLRRTKAEVEKLLPPKREIHLFVQLTPKQKQMYSNVLLYSCATDNDDKKRTLQNKLMQLRKVCLHPYLFPDVEDKDLPPLGEHLIDICGKMKVLDKLLNKLAQGKHQILIFSQFTTMLDILEDYCRYREYRYCRIDGDTEMDERDKQILDFTAKDSKYFIFLLSTRAGGLGINLATADTVIIYDSDFNPQMDLQAMDRAHRIGQKNNVMVYRMACEHTVEEKIIERQQIKLKWDNLMIQQGRNSKSSKFLSRDDLKDITYYGASQIFKTQTDDIKDEDIDLLLIRGEQRTLQMNEELNKKFQELQSNDFDLGMQSINIFEFFEKKNKEDEELVEEMINMNLQNEPRLNRRGGEKIKQQPVFKKQGKVVRLHDFQLYDNMNRLQELMQKQEDYLANVRFAQKYQTDEPIPPEVILTDQEQMELEQLSKTGFENWNKQEFQDFIGGCEKFGRTNFPEIAKQVETKSEQEIRNYAKVFWEKLDSFNDKDKILKQIERGEKNLQIKDEHQKLLDDKCSKFFNPKVELVFSAQLYNKFKSKIFTLENDKFLIYTSQELGYGNWSLLKRQIKYEEIFRFDHAFKCKTENELKLRVLTLMKLLEREKETESLGRHGVVQGQTQQQQLEKPKRKKKETNQKISQFMKRKADPGDLEEEDQQEQKKE